MDYSPWGHKESNLTEQLSLSSWVLTSVMNNKASLSKIKQLPIVSSSLHFQFVGYSNPHVILIYINYL